MANYSSSHTGAVIDSAVTDLVALVGGGLSKDLTLSGNDLVLGSGDGVDFDAAAGGTSALLDWYEEGTWTPTPSYGGDATDMAFTRTPAGLYTRIGNICFITGLFVFGAAVGNDGSGTGGLQIGNLPFTAAGGTDSHSQLSVFSSDFSTISGGIQARVSAGGTNITFRETTTGAGAALTDNDTNRWTMCSFTGVYSI